MTKPIINIITSETSGLNVRVINALRNDGRVEIKRIIFAQNNRPFNSKIFLRKLRKIVSVGILGAISGVCTRHWYAIKSDNLADYCRACSLPLTTVAFLNSSATRGLLALDQPDFILSLGNGYLRTDIISLARKTALNIHLEKLPEYPGARSVVWRLYNGETKVGYTVHEMNSQIDRGQIYHMTEVDIDMQPTLPQTISNSLEALVIDLEQHIAQIIIDINDVAPNNQSEKRSTEFAKHNSYTTPTFFELLKIWLQFYRLRTQIK